MEIKIWFILKTNTNAKFILLVLLSIIAIKKIFFCAQNVKFFTETTYFKLWSLTSIILTNQYKALNLIFQIYILNKLRS